MYDHERVAYASGPADIFGVLLGSAQRLAKLVDGYIIPSGTYFEPVGVPYCREYYKKRGQELFTVGLQTHELAYADSARIAPSNERVRAFLEDAATKYGPQSVLYISFGYVSIDAVHVLCGINITDAEIAPQVAFLPNRNATAYRSACEHAPGTRKALPLYLCARGQDGVSPQRPHGAREHKWQGTCLRLLGGAAGDPPTPRPRLVLHARRLQVSLRCPTSMLSNLLLALC